MNPATPQPQLDNNSLAALLAFPNRTKATAFLGARPSEAKLEAEASARAGMSLQQPWQWPVLYRGRGSRGHAERRPGGHPRGRFWPRWQTSLKSLPTNPEYLLIVSCIPAFFYFVVCAIYPVCNSKLRIRYCIVKIIKHKMCSPARIRANKYINKKKKLYSCSQLDCLLSNIFLFILPAAIL